MNIIPKPDYFRNLDPEVQDVLVSKLIEMYDKKFPDRIASQEVLFGIYKNGDPLNNKDGFRVGVYSALFAMIFYEPAGDINFSEMQAAL